MAVDRQHASPPGDEARMRRRGPVSRLLDATAAAIVGVALAIAVATAIDLAQVAIRWTAMGEGPQAMRATITDELAIVARESAELDMHARPVNTLLAVNDGIYRWMMEKMDLPEMLRVFGLPVEGRVADYYLVALLSLQQTAMRLVELLYALPIFLLFASVGIVDGLTKRDLRRRGGARESSAFYDLSKRSIPLAIGAGIVAYVAWTTPMDPAIVMWPGALTLGFLLRTTAGSYKKYF